MVLIIDNYDSFTYNLVQYIGEFNNNFEVKRNDEIKISDINIDLISHIIISPGPCTPKEAGISKNIIKKFYTKIPILGVCLGHQCIGEVFGATVSNAQSIMHGKTSKIFHTNSLLFKDIPSPFEATRYHSLEIIKKTLPNQLIITSHTINDEIMSIEHKNHPIFGVQFHPESFLTMYGKKMINNFLNI